MRITHASECRGSQKIGDAADCRAKTHIAAGQRSKRDGLSMKAMMALLLFVGLSMLALHGFDDEAWPSLLYLGVLAVLAAYLAFLVFLYRKKVDVYARGGIIRFSESPWGYRFYFFLLLLFWLVPSIGMIERLAK